MRQFSILILLLTFVGLSQAQSNLKNMIDIRLGYGGIDGLSGMTFLSAGYGRQIKNGFILKGNYLKGSGSEKLLSGIIYNHGSINIYGLGLQKAVNTSGASSINLGLGYKLAHLTSTSEDQDNLSGRGGYYHGVDVDLSYLHNINDRIGIYAGANFTTGIAMFSVNAGTCVYF